MFVMLFVDTVFDVTTLMGRFFVEQGAFYLWAYIISNVYCDFIAYNVLFIILLSAKFMQTIFGKPCNFSLQVLQTVKISDSILRTPSIMYDQKKFTQKN